MNHYREFISGALSGVIEVSTTHWIDNLKVRIQYANLSYNKPITKYDMSFRNLYWGFIPRIIGIIPMRTVFWGAQTYFNDIINKDKFGNFKYFVAGYCAGTIQGIVHTPIELIKTKTITNKGISIKNSNIFRGLTSTVYRDALFCGIFNHIVKNNKDKNDFIAGGFAGIIASIISHPLDVVKTEIQKINSKSDNTIKIFLNMCKTPSIMLSGIIPRMALSFCTMSVGYVSFTFIYSYLYSY